MLMITSTRLTDDARRKARESTGEDPGQYVHRIHRDGCPRIKPADAPQPVDAASARAVLKAKACTRCSPPKSEVETLLQKAEADVMSDASKESATATDEVKVEKTEAKSDAPKRRKTDLDYSAVKGFRQDDTIAVSAGPAPWVDKKGRIYPMRPAAYPEVHDDADLFCASHQEFHKAKSFPLIGNKGSGKGRGLECRAARDARLKWNKENPDNKKDLPHLDLPIEV